MVVRILIGLYFRRSTEKIWQRVKTLPNNAIDITLIPFDKDFGPLKGRAIPGKQDVISHMEVYREGIFDMLEPLRDAVEKLTIQQVELERAMTMVDYIHTNKAISKIKNITSLDKGLVQEHNIITKLSVRKPSDVGSSLASFYDCHSRLPSKNPSVSLGHFGDISSVCSQSPEPMLLLPVDISPTDSSMDRCLTYRTLSHIRDNAGNEYSSLNLWWLETARKWRKINLQWPRNEPFQSMISATGSSRGECDLHSVLEKYLHRSPGGEGPTILRFKHPLHQVAHTTSVHSGWSFLHQLNTIMIEDTSPEPDDKVYMSMSEEWGCTR